MCVFVGHSDKLAWINQVYTPQFVTEEPTVSTGFHFAAA
jgi:hypothetical protein